MPLTKLHGYQEEAVNTIAEKFRQYLINPPLTGTAKNPSLIPFIYSLKSITGSGKTAMLAALTAQISKDLHYPLSEVYSIQELINGLTTPLLNNPNPLIYLTTTGIFNIQTKEGRLIYQSERADQTNNSTWELLIKRPLHEKKRGLIIIYDEGQHLTEQQINRLLELAPNALILASGTPKDLVFAVSNNQVVATGLIKNKLRKLNGLAVQKGLPGLKVIYICKTNVLEKEKFEKDNKPKKIAVCANLELKKDFPPPTDFILFDGQSGQDYQNIGSDIQAQQLIGRALRTPQGKHYRGQYKDLNTAYFYIKTSNKEFSEIVSKINKELEKISDLIKLDVPTKSEKKRLTPVLVKKARYLPQIAVINQAETELAIRNILINKVKDYSQTDPTEIEPEDKRAIMDYHIGKNTPLKVIWEKFSFRNKVSVRNVLRRNIMSRNSRALDLTDLSSLEYKEKLDFLIGRNSPAEQELKELAGEIVDTYLTVIQLITQADKPLPVPDMNVNLNGEYYEFENSLHKYYSNLNPVEHECARMIDELDDETLVAVETTGKSLLKDKLDRKLFTIESFAGGVVPAGEIVPPRKVRVGVISTTDTFGKYRVY
ncbi:5421_t:CDS:2 [Ambispora gerdemannii]|uniref:5421_t:CDS:1 n=1 Tax=Ambispora gerdemannii TaxID=144530 RepID=A0A9N9AKG6_9GLOM|nr:5421_t:CDS:2 [Ambispora gerdemannii]